MNRSKSRACAGKVRHSRRRHAEIAARISGAHHADLTLVAYQCPHCGGWHVGHPRKGDQRRLHFERLLALIDRANRP